MNDDPKIRFLIVDDHQSIRKLCMTVGASLGFDCREADSAEAALAFLETDSPDIVGRSHDAEYERPRISPAGEADAAAE